MSSERAEPWLAPAEQHAWRTFIRLHQKLAAAIGRDLQTHSGLSGADFEILVALTGAPSHRRQFQELAKAVGWEQSRLSHHITRMARRGLVSREVCARDGRVTYVCLTAAGHDVIRAAAPHHVAAVRRLVIDTLAPEDLATLARLSTHILDRLDAPSTT